MKIESTVARERYPPCVLVVSTHAIAIEIESSRESRFDDESSARNGGSSGFPVSSLPTFSARLPPLPCLSRARETRKDKGTSTSPNVTRLTFLANHAMPNASPPPPQQAPSVKGHPPLLREERSMIAWSLYPRMQSRNASRDLLAMTPAVAQWRSMTKVLSDR